MTEVVMLSLWRNDAHLDLQQRMDHLLSKVGVTRWVWVVGNSSDSTEMQLRRRATDRVEVLRYDSAIEGNEPDQRLRRLSDIANQAYERVRPSDDYWVSHESDLVSPVDVVPRLLAVKPDLARDHQLAAAGWVTLDIRPGCFYDTYAYRKNGIKFLNDPPYHPNITLDRPFQVDSAGSVLLYPAQPLRDGVRMHTGGLIEVCDQLRHRGVQIWVDPAIPILQMKERWTGSAHPSY